MTAIQKKALTILKDTTFNNAMSGHKFAELMWGESHPLLFTKVSNQGNGACHGKASWLCAGSYLAKLKKKGWIWINHHPTSAYITDEGKKLLREFVCDGCGQSFVSQLDLDAHFI